MWAIAYLYDDPPRGWYVVDLARMANGYPSVLAGPYGDHADALEALKTRVHRVAQGWKP
jgi:hypothetical protein